MCVCLLWLFIIYSSFDLIWFNLISFNSIHSQRSIFSYTALNIYTHIQTHNSIYPMKCDSFFREVNVFLHLFQLVISLYPALFCTDKCWKKQQFNRISVRRRFFMTLSGYDQCFVIVIFCVLRSCFSTFFPPAFEWNCAFFVCRCALRPTIFRLNVWFVSQFKYHACATDYI